MAAPRPLIPLLFLLLLSVMVPHQTACSTINICGWSGVRETARIYIVNDNYPRPIPPQPHRCQCTLHRPAHSTALMTGVALIVRDAYFTGNNCQQKLYVEFPEHSTQNTTVCSSSQRVTNRTIFSKGAVQSAVVTLTFDKDLNICDAGTFMIEVQVIGQVAIHCSAQQSTLTNEPETANLGLIAGVAVGGVLLLGIIIIVVLITRFRRCLHCDGSSRTCIQSADVTPPGVTSSAPVLGDPGEGAGTDDNPGHTSSSRHYEPFQVVTTSTPVTYANVQASNYESLDVASNDPDSSILPIATYEVFYPNTHPI